MSAMFLRAKEASGALVDAPSSPARSQRRQQKPPPSAPGSSSAGTYAVFVTLYVVFMIVMLRAPEQRRDGATEGNLRTSEIRAESVIDLIDADNPYMLVEQEDTGSRSRERRNPAAGSKVGRRMPICNDTLPDCLAWAKSGECERNPVFMIHGCKESCALCVAPEVKEAASLADGSVAMPMVGFGTAGLGAATAQAVQWAYEAGYRHFDSAQAREWYREDLVGEALRSQLIHDRSSLFITSKLHPRHLGYHTTIAQVQASLIDLHTDYLDLFMLHYPRCWGDLCGGVEPEGTWKDSWKALEDLWTAGAVKSIGVSNFGVEELAELLRIADVKPHAVQANSDPYSQNRDLQDFCRANGIQFVAYSSLGSQWMTRGFSTNPVLENPIIRKLAEQHEVSEAQVVMRWALQMGQAVIPRSSKQHHIEQNFNLWGFELSDDAMDAITALDGHPPSQ